MKTISTHLTQPKHAYSQAVVSGSLVFTAGHIGIDPASGKIAEGIEQQAELALRNLAQTLSAAGSSMNRVLKTTCLLADNSDFAVFDLAYRNAFGDHKPARMTFGAALPGAILIEIDAVAETS